jgi:hypothetical protein
MKRALLISAMLVASVAGAHADHYTTMYRDLIRPHGQPRSDAIYQANLDVCYDRTHADRMKNDTPAFKTCMLGRGYRWQYTRLVRDAPPVDDAEESSPPPDVSMPDHSNDDIQALAQSEIDAANAQNVQNSIDLSNAMAAQAAQDFQ